MRPYAEAAGLDDPLVCYQGAVVADPATGEFLRHEPIPLAEAREAIAAVEAEGFGLNCYVGDELYVAAETPESQRYATFQSIPIHTVGPLARLARRTSRRSSSPSATRDELDELELRLKAHFGERLFISKSLPYFLEFARAGVTKGSGMAFVAERLGFSAGGDGRVRGRRERRRAPRVGRALRSPSRTRTRGRCAAADEVCPSVDDEGVAQTIEALLDSLA